MCLHPLKIKNPNFGKMAEVYNQGYLSAEDYCKNIYYTVPCGKCFECRMKFSNEWAFRCFYESKQHTDNCSVTLTYRETNGELNKKHVQKLFKDLRNRGIKFRYFGCGEYGARGGRPHYHICFFGWKPNDLEFFKYSQKGHNPLFKSRFLEKVWQHGYVLVESFTVDSARYASLYMQKFNKVKNKKVQPFRLCSRKPAIGTLNFDYETVIKSDKLYAQGKFISTPRIYIRKGLALGYDDFNDLMEQRQNALEQFEVACDFEKYVNRLERANRFKYVEKKHVDVVLEESDDVDEIQFPVRQKSMFE